MKASNWVARFLAPSLLTIALSVVSWAQVGTSTVTGSVTDPQGNAVVGATVRLINNQGGTRTVVTNNNGVYQFPSVQTGTYRIEVEQAGFKKASISGVQALVDISTEINVRLEIGQVTEVVNVEAADLESIVNTQDASIGNNFVSRQILSLPLNARNVANLLSLQPGVTPDGSVTGGRSDQANITLDGVDVNNQQDASAFAPVLRVNPDSVDEFRVTTANPDASKGRSSGAQISLITKSGSNQWNGALYHYHRNTATTANDWFSNAAGNYGPTDTAVLNGTALVGDPRAPRPQLLRNLFGGRIGGPVVKDRFFFFYNYEGMREAKGTPVTRTVPRASLGQGIIQFVDNTGQSWSITTPQINSFTLTGGTAAGPVVDVNSAVVSLFANAAARYPANDNTTGDGRNTGGFRFNAPAPVEQNAHTARFDWNVTSDQKHQVTFRGNYQQDIAVFTPFFPDRPAPGTWSHPLGFSATHTWLMRSNLTNRFSYGLTRLAFSNQGESTDPDIWFRYIYLVDRALVRALDRTNPTQNITNDLTWIKGNHSWQFGTNVRLIKNERTNFVRSFDNAYTNPSGYASNVARTVINQYITAQTGSTRSVASAWDVPTQGALVALLGRLNIYGANFNFDTEGRLLAPNTGVTRIFETKEYDFYAQDTWKLRPNLTLTMGLRYGLSMPVTETQGYETVPNITLSTYLANTIDAMNRGINYRETLSVRKAGRANGLDDIYPLDKNNWQPRVSVAWSPEFENGLLRKLFGGKSAESVFRAGFSITNDYFGQQLATQWDGANSLGFASTASVNVNVFNITTFPAPEYTGPSMNIRTFSNLTIPTSLTFPQTAPFTIPGAGKIETSLDQNLISPVNYSWNFSYGRRLPGNIWIDAAYVARLARNLLVGRDAMMLRDIRDPQSGMSYNEASTILDVLKQQNAPASQVPNLAFFNNMWPAGSIGPVFGCPSGIPNCTNSQAVYNLAGPTGTGDWTYMMQTLDRFMNTRYFFQGQYDALSAFSTIGTSDYHGATLSVRQRTSNLTWDFNYTFSKSLDLASGLQTGGLFGSTFILNAFRTRDQRAVSDFDLTHVVNFNGVWDMPFGRGQKFGTGMNKVLDAFIGGWQLSAVYRWDSGYPFAGYFDSTGWQTNWQIRSYATQLRPVETGVHFNTAAASCTSGCSFPNLFANPDQAFTAWRTPHPGETGTRNPIRLPGHSNLDAGLQKSFRMPWREGHKATIRWEVFNVTNSPTFAAQATGVVGYTGSSAQANFGRFTGVRGGTGARVMQFAFRYDF